MTAEIKKTIRKAEKMNRWISQVSKRTFEQNLAEEIARLTAARKESK